jgi:hypothetical protein
MKVAPAARRIFDPQRKTTFATKSAYGVISLRRGIWSLIGA